MLNDTIPKSVLRNRLHIIQVVNLYQVTCQHVLPFSLEPQQWYPRDGLVGLVVKASASRAEDPGFDSRLRRDFFRVESYQ